jgi:hypothetical protein
MSMNDALQDSVETHETNGPPARLPATQAQLYDDLRRIGQLEDQKYAIQKEIDERTERLRQAIPTLDSKSLLYRMLAASMGGVPVGEKKTARKQSRTPKKQSTRKRG